MIRKDLKYIVLILIGLLQPIGYLINSSSVAGIGAVTCISPLPTVFSKIRGIEAFSSTYWITYENVNNEKKMLRITPEVFSGFSFSYNLVNVYSISIGYLPTLPQPMVNSVLRHAVFDQKIFKEQGIDENSKNVTFHTRSNAKGLKNQWEYHLK